ncbi:sarcosine oxidase subunit beta [Catenulispora sp. GAS73]|uniref:NAD(P)/FAD-dependent oxidoreductase n=1 Tax=Catenulispora sp. GAS73 TaxID=3156269 RepID=UPI003515FFB4
MSDHSEHEVADVIVVGAGVLGTSVAHHLLTRGAGRVVVVEAGTSAAATSGAGAGFVGLWAAGYAHFLTETELALEQYGIDFYRSLAEADPTVECKVNGNLYLATTEEGWKSWVEPVVGHRLAPAGTREVSPAQVAEVTGGVVPAEAVFGGALHPGGIQISAGRATRALAARVAELGGELRERTRVTELLVSDGAVAGVRTDAGDIRAPKVVLACGAWTNELLAAVGWRVPLLRMVATRVVSPPSGVPGTMPTLMVPDLYGLWVREHRGGLTWGNGDGYAPSYEMGSAVGVTSRPGFPELVERLDEVLVPKLRALVPSHDISMSWWLQGIPCMTPDRKFLAGPVPGVEGLHVLTGDNEAGVTHGPGLGRLLADVVLDGGSDWVDPSSYRLDRFAREDFATEKAVLEAMPARR